MSHVPKNKITWQPTATLAILQHRAKILNKIRCFFAEREVLEVETPLLASATVTDPHIESIPTVFQSSGEAKPIRYYLQTSPEYAMKRLLAVGSGSIYQITKAFRQGEVGRLHNPEFTLLEWYRVGFDHHQLMDEMDELLQTLLKTKKAERVTVRDIFQHYTGLDPHSVTALDLKKFLENQKFAIAFDDDFHTLYDLVFSHFIEPYLGLSQPLFLYDYPIHQAALAKIRMAENPPVASRFEVYIAGLEIANGFHELQNAEEQKQRFDRDLKIRAALKKNNVPIDQRFLASLQQGLPACAGVALGLDRLMMVATGVNNISAVLSFAW